MGSSQSYASGIANVRFFNDSKALAQKGAHPPPSAEERKTMIGTRTELAQLYNFQAWYCDEMLSNVQLMKEVGHADLIVGELIYLCSSLIADILSLPHVTLSASSLSTPTAFAFSLPFSPSYVPQWNVHLSDEWSIFDRVWNLLRWMSNYLAYAQDLCSVFGNVKLKHNITPEKSIQETLGRVDLIIGQMHFGLEHPRPLYPSEYFSPQNGGSFGELNSVPFWVLTWPPNEGHKSPKVCIYRDWAGTIGPNLIPLWVVLLFSGGHFATALVALELIWHSGDETDLLNLRCVCEHLWNHIEVSV